MAKKHTKAIYRRKISLVDYEREEGLEYLDIFDKKYLFKELLEN